MATAMNKVVNHNPKLNGEERNLLSVAYKNMLGGIRTSLRRCLPDETGDAVRNECVTKYRRKLEEEVEDVCSKAIDLLENHLQPNNLDLEEKVFYLKM